LVWACMRVRTGPVCCLDVRNRRARRARRARRRDFCLRDHVADVVGGELLQHQWMHGLLLESLRGAGCAAVG
jgi:hypothetical protein